MFFGSRVCASLRIVSAFCANNNNQTTVGALADRDSLFGLGVLCLGGRLKWRENRTKWGSPIFSWCPHWNISLKNNFWYSLDPVSASTTRVVVTFGENFSFRLYTWGSASSSCVWHFFFWCLDFNEIFFVRERPADLVSENGVLLGRLSCRRPPTSER